MEPMIAAVATSADSPTSKTAHEPIQAKVKLWFTHVSMSDWRCDRFLIAIAASILLTECGGVDHILQRLPQSISAPPTKSPTGSSQSAATQRMEYDVRQQINTIRQQQGLVSLRHNDPLAQVARRYSQRMAKQNFFAHVSPQGDTLSDRVKSAKIFYFVVGENLFTSKNIPQPTSAAIQGWMNSPGHRENILRPEFRETGVGVWRRGNTYYFTQLFMRSL